jgi:ribose 5-phosphate isomerase A
LGSKAPLPVEVVEFAHEATARHIATLNITPVLRMRDLMPFRTDNGNLIYDCARVDGIDDIKGLQKSLQVIAGVVETGLFLGIAEQAIIGAADGSCKVMKLG